MLFSRANALPFLRAVRWLFVPAAVFHLGRVLWPEVGDASSPIRHAVFVAINATCVFWLADPPRWLWVVFAPFAVQQVASHGSTAVVAWQQQGLVDVTSWVIVVLMPAIWVALWVCRNAGRSRSYTSVLARGGVGSSTDSAAG